MDGLALSLASVEQLITQVVGLPLGTALKLKYCADEVLSRSEPAPGAPTRQGMQPPEPPPTLAHPPPTPDASIPPPPHHPDQAPDQAPDQSPNQPGKHLKFPTPMYE